MNRLARVLYRGRVPLLLVFLGLALYGLRALPQVRMSFSIDPLIEGDVEERTRANRLEAEMPATLTDIVVVLTWPQEIGTPALARARTPARPHARANPTSTVRAGGRGRVPKYAGARS